MLDLQPRSPCEPSICLTLAGASEGNPSGGVRVVASRLLAYDQQIGFTRLTLIGGTTLEVREPTDQIDRLVRTASQSKPALQ